MENPRYYIALVHSKIKQQTKEANNIENKTAFLMLVVVKGGKIIFFLEVFH